MIQEDFWVPLKEQFKLAQQVMDVCWYIKQEHPKIILTSRKDGSWGSNDITRTLSPSLGAFIHLTSFSSGLSSQVAEIPVNISISESS